MKTIFQFDDFREFIRYRFNYLRQSEKLSYRSFSSAAGFGSPTYLALVVEGKRNVTDASALKFGKGLKLSEKETDYLMLLASLNQTEVPLKKELYSKALENIRTSLSLE